MSQAVDLEMFSQAPWLSGFIHEASHGVPVLGVHVPPSIPDAHREERDRFFLASPQHRRFINAQGTMAREIARRNALTFGVFARAAFINDPTFHGPSVADTLTVEGFAQAWNFTTGLLQPDIVGSLNTARFVPLTPATPPLYAVFEQCWRRLLQGEDGC